MPALSSSPIVAALIQSDMNLDEVSTQIRGEPAVLSLLDALAQIPDPRSARGVRHGVLAVLVVSACAVLSGARSFVAIAEYAHDAGQAVLDLLGIGAVAPHESTIRRLRQQLDPDAVEAALSGWACAQLRTRGDEPGVPQRERRRVWALDGKTVRGARHGESGPVHLVSVLDQASGVVLAQVQVDAKSGELAAVPILLAGLDLTEVLISADALHTQRSHARHLHDRGGYYVLTVKANQPTLLARLRELPWAQIGAAARERARGHGRVETRTISVVSLHPCPDLGGEFFPPRRPGHQTAAPTPTAAPRRAVANRDRLRDHQSHQLPGRPGPARPLDPRTLGHRKPVALGP